MIVPPNAERVRLYTSVVTGIIELSKVMPPAPAADIEMVASKVIAFVKRMLDPAVIEAPSKTVPPPFCVNELSVIFPSIVRRPAFV